MGCKLPTKDPPVFVANQDIHFVLLGSDRLLVEYNLQNLDLVVEIWCLAQRK